MGGGSVIASLAAEGPRHLLPILRCVVMLDIARLSVGLGSIGSLSLPAAHSLRAAVECTTAAARIFPSLSMPVCSR